MHLIMQSLILSFSLVAWILGLFLTLSTSILLVFFNTYIYILLQLLKTKEKDTFNGQNEGILCKRAWKHT